MPKKTITHIPERENIYATLIPDGTAVYYITSDAGRMAYRLYKREENGVSLIDRADSPLILENKYITYGPETDTGEESYNNDIPVTPFEMQEHEDKRRGIVRPVVSDDKRKEEQEAEDK